MTNKILSNGSTKSKKLLRELRPFVKAIEKLKYIPDTGEFIWKKTAYGMSKGCKAGGKNADGYTVIYLNRKQYLASTVAFFFMNDSLPEGEVKYLDGNIQNNAWENLHFLPYKPIQSGVKGVRWNKRINKWQSFITTSGKTVLIGTFKALSDAIESKQIADNKQDIAKKRAFSEIIPPEIQKARRATELFRYFPDTGDLCLLNPTPSQKAHHPIQYKNADGYNEVLIDGQPFSASILAFSFMEDKLPNKKIGYRDKNTSNDAWNNLYLIPDQRESRDSGIIGVRWNKGHGKWQSFIMLGKRRVQLGYFDELDDAAHARLDAERRNFIPTYNPNSKAYVYLEKRRKEENEKYNKLIGQ